LKKLGLEGSYLNTIKAMYSMPVANIVLNREKLKAFLLKSEMRQNFKVMLEILAKAVRQEKEIK
jgi:hypothetical protein